MRMEQERRDVLAASKAHVLASSSSSSSIAPMLALWISFGTCISFGLLWIQAISSTSSTTTTAASRSLSLQESSLSQPTMLDVIVPISLSQTKQQKQQQQQHAQIRRRLLGETIATTTKESLFYETNTKTHDFVGMTRDTHLSLFEPSKTISTIGPTKFPKPSDKVTTGSSTTTTSSTSTGSSSIVVVPYMKPTYGQHRSNQDAVFVFAAEYSLATYILFVSTLRQTGFTGDIVMAVSQLDIASDQSVEQFFLTQPNLVVYVITFDCFNAEGQPVPSMKGGMRLCQLHHLYGILQQQQQQDYKTTTIQPLEDPRPPRTVPTTRYELYWIWSLNYQPHSWILLIDARDTIFQSNPFLHVPRKQKQQQQQDNNDDDNGMLLFFGENMEATRIGQSKQNRQWLKAAYGELVASALQDKPTICSGSTMGEQIALETYLRAMTVESDETHVKLMGADQGFHNYLYYSGKLSNAKTIHSIVVQDQGLGIINNLGAMRTRELEDWGNHELILHDNTNPINNANERLQVLNWNGMPSPVVHQFDRHPLLSTYWYKTMAPLYISEWKTSISEQRNLQ